MYSTLVLLIILKPSILVAQSGRCDQTPPSTKVLTPSENKGIYKLSFETKEKDIKNLYFPDQTYVLTLETTNDTRPFRGFMITAERDDDGSKRGSDQRAVDVGSLKTLDTDRQSRYSERCQSSIENSDSTEKYIVKIHWVSPKQSSSSQKVRLRAMVAENEEVWYTGGDLTVVLRKNENLPLDTPPFNASEYCNLCSEARYEVIFKGHWSRMSHPLHYPSKPYDNGYSHMVGASHSYKFTLWQEGISASNGLKQLAESGDTFLIEREIIDAMSSSSNSTRTLIRGKRRFHPHMFEPSHSLFRVDKVHHLFSIAVAMRPSPDWFLGTSKFELCTEDGWLEEYEIPLYPWDAGTMDGISYESPKMITLPEEKVQRVAVGSFDRDSPFYQMNLNDLKPFAYLQVRRLDVYPFDNKDCAEEGQREVSYSYQAKKREAQQARQDWEIEDDPKIAESRQFIESADECVLSQWGEWTACVPNEHCGPGTQSRMRYSQDINIYHEELNGDKEGTCSGSQDQPMIQYQDCFVDC